MDIFRQLAEAVHTQHREGDLPDFLVPEILEVADKPQRFEGQEDLVAELLIRVNEYETFSEMCCEKTGYGMEDIRRTLAKLHTAV
jgi:hypothetical protein